MKLLSNYTSRQEKSTSNTSTVPAYAGRNKDLVRYLESPKFLADFEKAMAEKAATK
jgi:hypothetical protein